MNRTFKNALLAVLLVASAFNTVGCNGDSKCVTAADCFQGEICSNDECVPGEATNADSGDDMGNGSPDGSSSSNSMTGNCVVSPFGNVCADDEFEPNDSPSGFAPLLWDNQSWCDGTELVTTQTYEGLTLCAGNERDVFRLMVDNRTPDNCITQQSTWTIEVQVKNSCDPALLSIKPYYNSPAQDDYCETDDRFRCGWSEDGTTYTIEQLFDVQQLPEVNLSIEAAEPREDLQIEYDVTLTIIQ